MESNELNDEGIIYSKMAQKTLPFGQGRGLLGLSKAGTRKWSFLVILGSALAFLFNVAGLGLYWLVVAVIAFAINISYS